MKVLNDIVVLKNKLPSSFEVTDGVGEETGDFDNSFIELADDMLRLLLFLFGTTLATSGCL